MTPTSIHLNGHSCECDSGFVLKSTATPVHDLFHRQIGEHPVRATGRSSSSSPLWCNARCPWFRWHSKQLVMKKAERVRDCNKKSCDVTSTPMQPSLTVNAVCVAVQVGDVNYEDSSLPQSTAGGKRQRSNASQSHDVVDESSSSSSSSSADDADSPSNEWLQQQ